MTSNSENKYLFNIKKYTAYIGGILGSGFSVFCHLPINYREVNIYASQKFTVKKIPLSEGEKIDLIGKSATSAAIIGGAAGYWMGALAERAADEFASWLEIFGSGVDVSGEC